MKINKLLYVVVAIMFLLINNVHAYYVKASDGKIYSIPEPVLQVPGFKIDIPHPFWELGQNVYEYFNDRRTREEWDGKIGRQIAPWYFPYSYGALDDDEHLERKLPNGELFHVKYPDEDAREVERKIFSFSRMEEQARIIREDWIPWVRKWYAVELEGKGLLPKDVTLTTEEYEGPFNVFGVSMGSPTMREYITNSTNQPIRKRNAAGLPIDGYMSEEEFKASVLEDIDKLILPGGSNLGNIYPLPQSSPRRGEEGFRGALYI